MSKEEYLRLPHGMFDRESEWIKAERLILEKHNDCGIKIGCELEKYSPLGYKSSFSKATHTADNKVYELSSKTGKDLLLSCDSSPSVMRKYVSSNSIGPKKVSFVAPIFRYKNSHTRHFTQIGYSFVNSNNLDSTIDFNLVQLTKAMIDLFESMNISTYIQVNNYKALKGILKKYTSDKDLDTLLYNLQFSDIDKRISIVDQNIDDPIKRYELIDLFSMSQQCIDDTTSFENLKLPEEYYEFIDTYDAIRKITGANIIFNPSDLHSIETIDDIALRFIKNDGVVLGDGGNYSNYANRWNKSINSLYSVATGVEVIERNKNIELNEDISKVAVYSIDASDDFVLSTMRELYENYDSVIFYGRTKNISKAIKKSTKDCAYFTVIGKDEEFNREVEVKNLHNWSSEIIKIDNKKIKIRK